MGRRIAAIVINDSIGIWVSLMIVEYIRYQLSNHTPAELTGAWETAAEHLRSFEGCLAYELGVCVEEPTHVIVRIQWTSIEAHTEGFRKSDSFRPFLKLIRPFFNEIAEMRHYEPGAVTWTR